MTRHSQLTYELGVIKMVVHPGLPQEVLEKDAPALKEQLLAAPGVQSVYFTDDGDVEVWRPLDAPYLWPDDLIKAVELAFSETYFSYYLADSLAPRLRVHSDSANPRTGIRVDTTFVLNPKSQTFYPPFRENDYFLQADPSVQRLVRLVIELPGLHLIRCERYKSLIVFEWEFDPNFDAVIKALEIVYPEAEVIDARGEYQ